MCVYILATQGYFQEHDFGRYCSFCRAQYHASHIYNRQMVSVNAFIVFTACIAHLRIVNCKELYNTAHVLLGQCVLHLDLLYCCFQLAIVYHSQLQIQA